MAQAVSTGSRHGQLARAVGHIPSRGRIVPFRRVAQAAKQIVKARKPQSCALFSSQILRFCYRCPAFCSCVPVLCSGGQPFYFRWSGILPPVSHHSAPGCQPFYFPVSRNSTSATQDSAPTAHSISPKGHSPLSDSAFQFPTFSITFPKPTITTSRPTSPVTRAQKPRFCARGDWDWHREER